MKRWHSFHGRIRCTLEVMVTINPASGKNFTGRANLFPVRPIILNRTDPIYQEREELHLGTH